MPQDPEDEPVDESDSFRSPYAIQKKKTNERNKSSHGGSSFKTISKMENLPSSSLAKMRINNQPTSIALSGGQNGKNTFIETKGVLGG